MLTFFERSPLDQVLRNDKVHRIQPCFQSPIKISGAYLVVFCNMEPLLTSLKVTLTSQLIQYCTLHLFRNHAVQWILFGQHRNHCVWSQSPRGERETLIHWLCGTHVSTKTTHRYFSLSWEQVGCSVTQMTCWFSANISMFAIECSLSVLKSLNVNQTQDPPPPQEVCLFTSSFPGCV